MDDVNVHYHSNQPQRIQAHAFALGSEIHLASGQAEHLPHEAWHVVQQKQGQVQPTGKSQGYAINADSALETEASQMGEQAARYAGTGASVLTNKQAATRVIQPMLRAMVKGTGTSLKEINRPTDLPDDTQAKVWKSMQPETQKKAHSVLWFEYNHHGKTVLCKVDWTSEGFRAIYQAKNDRYYIAPKDEKITTVGAIISAANQQIASLGTKSQTLAGYCHEFVVKVYDAL